MTDIAGVAELLVVVARVTTDMDQVRTGQGGCGPGDAVAAITTEHVSPGNVVVRPGANILTVTVTV
jgi:hypothetical protein